MASALDAIAGFLNLANSPSGQRMLAALLHDVPEDKLIAALEKAQKETTPPPAGYVVDPDGRPHKKEN